MKFTVKEIYGRLDWCGYGAVVFETEDGWSKTIQLEKKNFEKVLQFMVELARGELTK